MIIVGDVHSYCVFANIDNRKGEIKGHQLILSKKQTEMIEDIITSENVTVVDDHTYEVTDG